ncbi:hypothetical protein ACFSQP_06850 [Bizionia sediminis]|uniref:HTH LytTR-type domain-containing protein n=1 Tax=Bizionia sediminis TaxID=1737064 RepID=A0ABW5KUQ1_9FLAO
MIKRFFSKIELKTVTQIIGSNLLSNLKDITQLTYKTGVFIKNRKLTTMYLKQETALIKRLL